MILLIIGGIGVLFVIGLIWLMRAEDRRDDRRDPLGLPPPDYTPLGPMPPEIAHDAPLDVQIMGYPFDEWPPETSPAVLPASPPDANYTGSRPPTPGTAAAAGHGPTPPGPPPPLPDPAYAAAAELPYDFAEWLSDTFVGRVEAIRKDAP